MLTAPDPILGHVRDTIAGMPSICIRRLRKLLPLEYSRASLILDQLEASGDVSKAGPGGNRKVLVQQPVLPQRRPQADPRPAAAPSHRARAHG